MQLTQISQRDIQYYMAMYSGMKTGGVFLITLLLRHWLDFPPAVGRGV